MKSTKILKNILFYTISRREGIYYYENNESKIKENSERELKIIMVKTKTHICYVTQCKVDIMRFQNQLSKSLEKGFVTTPEEGKFIKSYLSRTKTHN